MDPRRGVDAREDDFEQGEGGVEAVLRDVGPEGEGGAEVRVEDCPVDDCDEEGVGGYGAPEEVVEGLKGAREAV